MGKKGLNKEQQEQEQYAQVMKSLADKGVLTVPAAPAGTEPEPAPAPKRMRAKTPPGTEPAEAKPTKATSKPTQGTKRANPAAKEKAPAKAAKKDPEPKPSILEEEDDFKKDGTGSWWDCDLRMDVSWSNFAKVLEGLKEIFPRENEDAIKAIMIDQLGPCPPHLQKEVEL